MQVLPGYPAEISSKKSRFIALANLRECRIVVLDTDTWLQYNIACTAEEFHTVWGYSDTEWIEVLKLS